jgi:ribonucleoside-diphosphate reductase alpha chain
LNRPGELGGKTYKIQWPESDHAMYITINDIIDDTGRVRPFEIFINTKSVEHYAWMVALTRMISAVFRRGGDVSFVVEELKAVFDPRGGQWVAGRYVPSLLAAIGSVIEEHLRLTGFMKGPDKLTEETAGTANVVALGGAQTGAGGGGEAQRRGPPFRQCPKCGTAALIRQENCDQCTSCDYSKCS